jgi:hypothetical protein
MAVLGQMQRRISNIKPFPSAAPPRRAPGVRFSRFSVRFLFALIILFALGSGRYDVCAQPVSREYQLKAAFVYNFAQFTDWPEDVLADTSQPFVIGVLGTNYFGSALEEVVRGETVRGHKLHVEYYHAVEEIRTCHILFIGQSEDRRLEKILAALKGKPILTVSDIDKSAIRGVMVRFLTENNKLRFRVNVDSLAASHLTMSSKLLRVAEVVSSEKKP